MKKLPSEEKINWIVDNIPDSEKKTLLKDILVAAKKACETSDLKPLVETIVDWEATIEAYNNPELQAMIEGYREMAEEHRAFAEEALPLFCEVLAKEPWQ